MAAADRAEPPRQTFISETIAEDYGPPGHKADHIFRGEPIGYDQFTVERHLLDVLEALGKPVLLVHKLHPSSDYVGDELTLGTVRVLSVRDEPLWPLLWYSDAVVGMRSLALLEAWTLGCATASFQPGLMAEERSTAVRMGLVPGFREREAQLPGLAPNTRI